MDNSLCMLNSSILKTISSIKAIKSFSSFRVLWMEQQSSKLKPQQKKVQPPNWLSSSSWKRVVWTIKIFVISSRIPKGIPSTRKEKEWAQLSSTKVKKLSFLKELQKSSWAAATNGWNVPLEQSAHWMLKLKKKWRSQSSRWQRSPWEHSASLSKS